MHIYPSQNEICREGHFLVCLLVSLFSVSPHQKFSIEKLKKSFFSFFSKSLKSGHVLRAILRESGNIVVDEMKDKTKNESESCFHSGLSRCPKSCDHWVPFTECQHACSLRFVCFYSLSLTLVM